MLAAKTKEGSLDDQKKKCTPQKNANLISRPYDIMCWCILIIPSMIIYDYLSHSIDK